MKEVTTLVESAYNIIEKQNKLIKDQKTIIDKFNNDNGLSYEKSEVMVSCGAKHSLYNIACALLDAGDEVIIPEISYVKGGIYKITKYRYIDITGFRTEKKSVLLEP